MNKIKNILQTHFDIICTDISKINIGLSVAVNYKVKTDDKAFFLKVYDKNKAQFSLWTENINTYIPILTWLNGNTNLQRKIVRPIKTNTGDFLFENEESIILLFDYIDGEPVTKNSFTDLQILEIAEIMACLHSYDSNIPVSTDKIKEDFSVPFCISLENFIVNEYQKSPADIKTILQPYLNRLTAKNNELISLADTIKQKDNNMALCHTDAHYKNFMQNGHHLILVDWEGLKLAPAEADLFMFTQKAYWNIFIEHYNKLRPDFVLDNEMLSFYVLRRKIDDIWAFIESILYDNLSDKQRKRDLAFLLDSCSRLDDLNFEL